MIMQDKKYILSIAAAILFIISVPLPGEEKHPVEKNGKDKNNTKNVLIFDSCGKESAEKCKKESEIKTPDYSKSLK